MDVVVVVGGGACGGGGVGVFVFRLKIENMMVGGGWRRWLFN